MSFEYKLAKKEPAKCPLCDGASFATLAAVDRYRMGVNTVSCKTCGFITTNPVLSELELDKFYREDYRSVYSKVVEPSLAYIVKNGIDRRAQYIVEFISRNSNLPSIAHVLDVGCAEGSVLRALRNLRPELVAVGVEPGGFGEFAKTYADCDVVPALELAPHRTFDLILLNHVLEHARDPLPLLQELTNRLSPGGLLFVDVPDAAAYSEIEDLHVAHVHHFTSSSLQRLAVRAGLHSTLIEKHSPPRHPRSVRSLFVRSSEQANLGVQEPQADDLEAARRIQAIGSPAVWPTVRRSKPVRTARGLLRRAAVSADWGMERMAHKIGRRSMYVLGLRMR